MIRLPNVSKLVTSTLRASYQQNQQDLQQFKAKVKTACTTAEKIAKSIATPLSTDRDVITSGARKLVRDASAVVERETRGERSIMNKIMESKDKVVGAVLKMMQAMFATQLKVQQSTMSKD